MFTTSSKRKTLHQAIRKLANSPTRESYTAPGLKSELVLGMIKPKLQLEHENPSLHRQRHQRMPKGLPGNFRVPNPDKESAASSQ